MFDLWRLAVGIVEKTKKTYTNSSPFLAKQVISDDALKITALYSGQKIKVYMDLFHFHNSARIET